MAPRWTVAIGNYPHTAALKSGAVRSDLLDLEFPEIKPVNRAFAPMARELKFDVSEMAIATFLQAKAFGKALTLLPLVTAARFQEAALFCLKSRPIESPADLKGKRVGVNRGSSVEGELVKRERELNLTISRFDDDATTMQALFSGQVEAVASPDAQSNAAIKARGDTEMEQKFVFSKQPNSMTMKSDAFELHQWLNNVIYLMKLNGELNDISLKWVGSPLPNLPTF